MTSDNCASAFEEDEKLDIPTRKRSLSRYSSRHKNRKVDKNSRHHNFDGYSTTSANGQKNESDFEEEVANNSTHGFYQGNDDQQQNRMNNLAEQTADLTRNNPKDMSQKQPVQEYKPPMKPQASINNKDEEESKSEKIAMIVT